ncbi:bifunctional oligoribonuclease/PAP phosphatase NrnA [Candidatus Latescibacterota bacterium]
MKNDLVFYPENSASWRSIQTVLEEASRVFITTHVNPDGDAIGSVIALGRFLVKMDKQMRIINESKTPAMYAFLDPDGMIESYDVSGDRLFHDAPSRDDVVVFLDLGDYERAGKVAEFLLGGGARTIIVDHHDATPAFADIAVVNPHAESTGSLVYDLMRVINPLLIDSPIAEVVLAAIVTDTGYFTYSNTTSTTMAIASSLYTYGISMHGLRKRIESTQPFSRQKLLGLCLAQIALADHGRIAWSYITTEMFEHSGSSREDTDYQPHQGHRGDCRCAPRDPGRTAEMEN